MKLFLFLLAALASTGCGEFIPDHDADLNPNNSSQPKPGTRVVKKHEKLDPFKVAFYNVENLFDTKDDPKTKDDEFTPGSEKEWTEDRYQTKLDHIAEVLSQLGDGLPDVIGLGEVENRSVVEDLVAHNNLKAAGYKIVHRDSPDQRGIDLAFLYNPKTFELEDHAFINIDGFSKNKLYSREIIKATGTLSNGEALHVFINHWPSRYKGEKETYHKREAAAKTLKAEVDKILKDDPNAQIIMTGDFNDYPDNKSLVEVLGAKGSTAKRGDLFNLAWSPHQKDEGTINYKGDWGMFDQMIVSKALLDGKDTEIEGREMHIFK